MRIGPAFTHFLPYPHTLPFLSEECLSAFESGEQIYLVNDYLGVGTCEQPVWVGLQWISINARPIRMKFVRKGIVSG